MKKVLVVFMGVVLLLLLTVGVWYLIPARTDPIDDPLGSEPGTAIAELTTVRLGGLEQAVLIRGRNRANPILLFLHGGPGMPMMYLAHRFQRPLEETFVVVQWDQRGAGKSFSEQVKIEDMTVEQMLADTKELINHLLERFDQQKLFLAGHSWGSYLGIITASRHPELLQAYIGIGQVVSDEETGPLQDAFIQRMATSTGNPEAISELESLGAAAREKWLFEFGGELYGETSWWPLLSAGLAAPEYSLKEVLRVGQGSSYSSRHMVYDAIKGPVDKAIRRLEVPTYFFTGRHDYTTPHALIERYHNELEAPVKKLVWFERSAHFPFFEEPEAFADRILKVVYVDSSR